MVWINKNTVKWFIEPFLQVIRFFKITDEESQIIQNEMTRENIRRVFYLSLVAIPASIIVIVIFGLELSVSTGITHRWRELILIAHFSIIILFSVIAAVIYFYSIRPGKYGTTGLICVYFTIFILITGGTAVTTFDQMVTSAITPFMITCIIASLIILIPPFYSIIVFTITYILFFFSLTMTQTDHLILISNQVNGLAIVAIGICLSTVLYKWYITRIEQQKVILKQNEQLIKSNVEKDKFFSIIAHDLKSPFNILLGFSNVLAENIRSNKPAEAEKYAMIVIETAENTYKLIENLLEWSTSATGHMRFNPELLNLSEVINEKLNSMNFQAQSKNISLKYDGDDLVEVFADRNMLNTIFRNLITNAIKFTHPGGSVVISIKKIDKKCEVTVTDTGVGISEQDMMILFEPGSKVSREGTAKEKGTGLGLILCKEFIELHHGNLKVESKPGKGSSFIFSLPSGPPV